MKVQQCEKNGVQGWQYGENGRCYVGNEAFQKAKREEMSAKKDEWIKNPAPTYEERKEALEEKYEKKIERSRKRAAKRKDIK